MSGQTARLAGVALAVLAAVAMMASAVVLITRGGDGEPVVIVAPGRESTAEPAINDDTRVGDIRVQVSGAVVSPGVYPMSEGDRVVDALGAAGGLRPEADLSGLNLAQRVQDEGHYHVPFLGEAPSPQAPSSASQSQGAMTGDASGGLVDINIADSRELETLPGIGPVTAGRIIAHREANGTFATIDELEDVPGIGPKTMESIRPLVTVSGRP